MKFNKVHCLFEQSGTFKNEFKKLGFSAFDYDLKDDFSQTDFQVDIFKEIETAYNINPCSSIIFNNISADDLIFAFFPCIRFESQSTLLFRGDSYSMRDWDYERKVFYNIGLHRELSLFYDIFCKMVLVAFHYDLRMIIENPYTQPHYLTQYFPIRPSVIDYDRREMGDFYKKPTQYWFINCTPECNFVPEAVTYHNPRTICGAKNSDGLSRAVNRSLIAPEYAERFIKTYIL